MRKPKRKYIKGNPITCLDELFHQNAVFLWDKVLSHCWFVGWQIGWAEAQIRAGRIRHAIPAETIDSKDIQR